jgi:hypothetical protein
MDASAIKIKNIETLHAHIVAYVDKISDTYVNRDINELLKGVAQHIKVLLGLSKTTSESDIAVEKIFHMVHLMEMSLYMISNILAILNKEIEINSNIIFSAATSTELDIITSLHDTIDSLYGTFTNKYQTIDQDIMKYMSDTVYKKFKWDTANTINNVSGLTQMVKKYIYSVSLYSVIMKNILEHCPSDDFGDQIINIIEEVKDFILVDATCEKSLPKSLYKNNPRISTFGLIPTGESKSLAQLTKEIFGQSISKISGLSTVSKTNGVCVVLLNNVIRHPIEFSLWKLSDWEQAKKFIQDENAGLNKKIIDRFTTIMFKDIPKQKWDFGSDFYGNINSQDFIVLEKLGDDTYRHLSIYTDNRLPGQMEDSQEHVGGSSMRIGGCDQVINADVFGGKLKQKIDRNKIAELIKYVSKGVSRGSRIGEYNKIQEKKIVKNMFLPIYHDIDSISLNSQIIDSKYLRHMIHVQLRDTCSAIIKTDFKKGASVKNIKDIGQILHNERLSDVFSGLIIEQYYIYTFKNKKNISAFSHAETFKTLLAQLQLLNRDFVRNIHDIFRSVEIDVKIFDEETTNKVASIMKIIETVMCATLDKIISNESNIYQSLIYKTSLLNLSVV